MTAPSSGAVLEHVIGATGRFHLRQFSGSIRISGVDGTTVRVRDRGDRALAESFRVEAGAGQLSLTAPDRSGLDFVLALGRRSSPDLEVEVPNGAEVSIETASADLAASRLAGRTRIRTASGNVTLDGVSGTVEIVAVSGDVRVVTDAGLDLKAQTISGDVSVRASRLGRAEIATTSGDVRLDAALSGSGPFRIETISGDATIVGRTGIRVESQSITGEVVSDLPHRRGSAPGRKAIVLGDGGTPFTFRSVSGGLRLIAPRDALPTEVIRERKPAVPPVEPGASSSAQPSVAPGTPGKEGARLDVLRALERGELTVEAAMQRIAEIEEA